MDIKKIREAILKNRAGHEKTTDDQLLILWQSIPSDAQTRYMDSIRKGKTNAIRTGAEPEISGNTGS